MFEGQNRGPTLYWLMLSVAASVAQSLVNYVRWIPLLSTVPVERAGLALVPGVIVVVAVRHVERLSDLFAPLDPEAPGLLVLARDVTVVPLVGPGLVATPEDLAAAAVLAVQGDAATGPWHGAEVARVNVGSDIVGDFIAARVARCRVERTALSAEVVPGCGGE